jgi:hypothetical protein
MTPAAHECVDRNELGEMVVSTLAELRQHSDVPSLKTALHQLCSEFGRITRLDILTAMHEGTKQAICFLRMERPEQEQQLMKSLGVGRFGGEVVFVLNLNTPVTTDDFGPSSQWADSDIY